MTVDLLSVVILVVFLVLLTIGASSTMWRWMRYNRLKLPQPRLLGRDRDLLLGLALPFLILAAVRVVPGLREFVRDDTSSPHIWYLLLTGLPPIYALAKYDWYELRIIERVPPSLETRNTEAAERTAVATERIAEIQEQAQDEE